MIALEILITDLGITEHMASLSNWRDELLREKAAELQAVRAEKDAELQAVTAERDQLLGLKTAMEAKVIAALQSGDPSQFAAIGQEFVTPEQEKIRAEKLAQLEALKLELGIE